MGDMPIYVGYHSADVWANKKHFLLVSAHFLNTEIYFPMLQFLSFIQLIQFMVPAEWWRLSSSS